MPRTQPPCGHRDHWRAPLKRRTYKHTARRFKKTPHHSVSKGIEGKHTTAKQFKVIVKAGKDHEEQTRNVEQGVGQRGKALIRKAQGSAKYQLVESSKRGRSDRLNSPSCLSATWAATGSKNLTIPQSYRVLGSEKRDLCAHDHPDLDRAIRLVPKLHPLSKRLDDMLTQQGLDPQLLTQRVRALSAGLYPPAS